jgi:hypothetical protein
MIDHLQDGADDMLESFTTISYLAALHPQLRFGQTVVCQSFRNPTLLAKMGATLQFLSGGRFMLGLGAGWNEEEYCIAVNPVVLGAGTPLFKPHAGRRELRLLGTRIFTSGIVELRYAQAEAQLLTLRFAPGAKQRGYAAVGMGLNLAALVYRLDCAQCQADTHAPAQWNERSVA